MEPETLREGASAAHRAFAAKPLGSLEQSGTAAVALDWLSADGQ